MGKLIENLVASDKSVHISEEVGSVIYLNALDTFGNIVKDFLTWCIPTSASNNK